MWQSAEDGEKGIDEDEKRRDNHPGGASLAHEPLSSLLTSTYGWKRRQSTELRRLDHLVD